MTQAVNLRCKTSLSHLQSCLSTEAAIGFAQADRQELLGICETASLASALDFATQARQADIQPILSEDLPFREGWLMLTALTRQGWDHLLALHNRTLLASAPVSIFDIDPQDFGGLAILDGAPGSILHQMTKSADTGTETYFDRLVRAHPAYFLEVRRPAGNRPEQRRHERWLDDISRRHNIPLVGTAQATMLPGQETTLQLLASIRQSLPIDHPEFRTEHPGQMLRARSDLATLFQDAPELLANAGRIALAVDPDAAPHKRKAMLPHYPPAHGKENEMLRAQAQSGLERHLQHIPTRQHAAYRARLHHELDIICQQGFAGYFLIVADFIAWARQNDIPVGPGRGSGAGSIAAWSCGITELDPIRWGLMFERFINPERISLPDFDVDFCQDRRDDVIDYVRRRYGPEQVVAIGAHSTWGARAAYRDAARSLALPNRLVNEMAALLPGADNFALETMEPDIKARFAAHPGHLQALEMAEPLQGLIRQHTRHAAGIIIADQPIGTLIPLMPEPGGDADPITQYDMKGVENSGLVKFDFLGLKTLSVIHAAIGHIRRQPDAKPAVDNPSDIPLDNDPATLETLNRGHCQGIFQLESHGIVQAAREIVIERFEDIIALVALYRPGPMEFIPQYAARKAGREAVHIPHPALTDLLRETFGILIYQEQIIELAQIVAGYSKGHADLLRRAIGKKIPEEMARQKQGFLEGCARNGIAPELADHLWSLTEKFAGYGFNKSHAAAYALLTWQTAWLKTHHPQAFYAAALTYVGDNHDKLRQIAQEALHLGIDLLPPDIRHSQHVFTVEQTTQGLAVRWGLSALKGIGRHLAETISARMATASTVPTTIPEVARILSGLGIGMIQCQALARSGSLDALDRNRARAEQHLYDCLRAETSTQTQTLFHIEAPPPRDIADRSPDERRLNEKLTIGLTFDVHPLERYRRHAQKLGTVTLDRARTLMTSAAVPILAHVEQIIQNRKNSRVRVTLSTPEGEIETVTRNPPPLHAAILAWIAQKTQDLPQIMQWEPFAADRCPGRYRLYLTGTHDWPGIRAILTAHGPGKDHVDIRIDLGEKGTARKILPPCFNIEPSTIAMLRQRPDVLDAHEV